MSDDSRWIKSLESFWSVRNEQALRQLTAGSADAGTRGSVTGGKHMDNLAESVAQLFRNGSPLDLDVQVGRRLRLPGFYRRAKDWDLVVIYRGVLVAAIEFKSQVGSFGNNFNNRTEEAIGNAADIWRAYEEGFFGNVRPWLGFVMVVEQSSRSTTPLGDSDALFPTDPVFQGTGYVDRYRILMQRLVREKQYDAAVVVAADPGTITIDEPVFDLSFANFEAAVKARIAYIEALPDGAFVI